MKTTFYYLPILLLVSYPAMAMEEKIFCECESFWLKNMGSLYDEFPYSSTFDEGEAENNYTSFCRLEIQQYEIMLSFTITDDNLHCQYTITPEDQNKQLQPKISTSAQTTITQCTNLLKSICNKHK